MSLLESIDQWFERDNPPKVLHLTREMLDRLIREDIEKWQEDRTETTTRLGYTRPDGQLAYRGVPIKIVGTGLSVE